MIFDFVFSKKEIRKGDFLQWMIDTMIQSGWQNLSATKPNVDNYTMFSTGESGNEKIGVEIKDHYTDEKTAYKFSTTTHGYIGAKPFHTYTPNPNINSRGAYTPTGAWVEMRILSSALPDEMLSVYYHVNKDRIILVVESPDLSVPHSATFFVFGKPYTIAQYDEYCASAVIASTGSYACRAGIFNSNSETTQYTSDFRLNGMPKSKFKNNQFASEILIQNIYDGDKYIVENIFASYHDGKTLTTDMRKNTFKDSEGRIYKYCVSNMTSNLASDYFRTFLIRIG